MRRKSRQYHKPHVEEDGEGNWLISYADLMTLLWGFFVILTAFSTPDVAKVEKLKEATSTSMGGKYESPYNELTDRLKQIIADLKLEKKMSIDIQSDGVKITTQDKYFFHSASAELQPESLETIQQIGEALKEKAKGFRVIVEGHSDDQPIKTKDFSSNWELSLKRSVEVVHMFEEAGLEHNHLRPVAVADAEPLVKIQGLEGQELIDARAKNRRIVILIQKIEQRRLSP